MGKIKLKKIDIKKRQNSNESIMKNRGEFKAKKNILTKDGKFKNISSTQKGQKIILDDALRILPSIVDWIESGSSLTYRHELKDFFKDEEIVLQKIVECFLFMAGSIYSQDGERKNKVKTRHKKVNNINEKIMPELSFENTWRFLEVIVDKSEFFTTETSIEINKRGFQNNIRYTCSLSEIILEEINILAMSSFYPLPMEVPPVDWSYENGEIKGGYETYQFEMIRSGSKDLDYSKYSQQIFDSINYIQSVPWIINKEVLHKVVSDLKMPVKSDFIKTEYPKQEGCRWDLKLKEEENSVSEEDLKIILKNREDYKDRAALYNAELSDFQSAVGKYRYVKLATQIAKKYVDKTIYFPHSFDFRGRIYPLPIGVSPQGSDPIKALLLYKNEEKITKHGLKWCWAYLASLYGDDKLDFKERIERGKELINADYKEADEPYQFLSHQIELQEHLKDNNYSPNVRIHLDACNSGSQFTSAITNDLKGCMATNVVPTINEDGTQSRQDAYLLVADKSIELAQKMFNETDDLEKQNTVSFLQNLLEKDGRKICKVPVMVSNYGGTSGGRSDILWNMLRKLPVDRKWTTKKVASTFSRIIGDSIKGVLNGGKSFEMYIHRMNNIIAKKNCPVEWTTSDGFHVVHSKNKELKPKIVSCIVPGARKRLSITKKRYSEELSSGKMKSAISPNYIHSLDAELLRRVALRMKRLGIMDTDWIHDSFGSHPNHIGKLLEVTKEVFLELMESEPIKLLDKQLRGQCSLDKTTQRELESIQIPNLNQGEKLCVKKVLESNWFFS